jgi:two-component system KDP operon response regulator KdpE
MSQKTILVVESESKWAHLLRQILSGAGYVVLNANKSERALQVLAEENPSLVLSETGRMGEFDGLELVRRIRRFATLPVILLSSDNETESVLRGFEAGADDFIIKPFDARILLARVKAVLNRCENLVSVPAEITCDNLVIRLAARQVTLNGAEVYLTETEYNLLLELARHRNQVMLHEQLLTAVWGTKYRAEIDYLRSYVHILRHKLETNPTQPKRIISRPGIGYMLVSETAEELGR